MINYWYDEGEDIPEDDEHGIHWNRAAELSLDLIKLHCRIDHDYDDELLGLYLDAAKDAVRQHTSRNWYDEGEDIPEDDEHGIYWNRAAELSMYLLIGHWYANREAVTEQSLQEMPQGFFSLIQPYRIHGL